MSSTGQTRPKKRKKWYEHKWWTAVGVFVAVAGIVAAWFLSPYSPLGNTAEGSEPSPSAAAGSTESGTPVPSNTVSSSSRPTTPVTDPGATSAAGSPLFLSDVDKKRFINQPYRHYRGAATADGKEYASSYFFKFENCSECTEETELNVPAGYQNLRGTVALTDESRHDSVIDGVAYFAIYSTTGELLLEPQRVEYPDATPFDVALKGSTRIRLVVSSGTNSEYPCWCDAQFTK